ncbi:MAG: hypothetical protein U1C96_13360 [Gallionella sp.]|nr:hypothetical protein [Gallionella sp.]
MKSVFFLSGLLCLAPFPLMAAEQFSSESDARQHCPDDTVVWLNLRSGSVHMKGQRWYGRTHVGAYVCRRELSAPKKEDAPAQASAPVQAPDEEARWYKVMQDDVRTVYAEASPSERNGSRVTLLSMMDLKEAAVLGDGITYRSWETQYEFDCQKKLSRMVAAAMYSGNMGEGDAVSSIIYQAPEWKAVPPGSNGETMWKVACSKKK